MRRIVSACLSLGLLAASITPAHATWPNNPGTNVPVCTAAYDQANQTVVSDGAGGTILLWQDLRGGVSPHIYAQRVLASGAVAWATDGIPVCTVTGGQDVPQAVTDGNGGAIVVWQDHRTTNIQVYAQHVLAGGSLDPAWPATGRAICTAAYDKYFPKIASDGAGGAVITWDDYRSGSNFDIYAQRVTSAGAVAWTTDGVVVCNASNSQRYPQIAGDGAGGAIVAWQDFRNGSHYDIYAQRITAAGAAAWTANGLALCAAAGNQLLSQVVADGTGGAIAVWCDLRGASYDIYAQHVLGVGTVDYSWPSDGQVVAAAAGTQFDPRAVSDDAGGVVVTWMDSRSISYCHIYAQRLTAAGAAAWTTDGVPICTATGSQYYPVLTGDGAGGAVITWDDQRSGMPDVYAQHVLGSGTVAWTSDGIPVSNATNAQQGESIINDGAGGTIIAWGDARLTSGANDIYAQRIDRFGYLGNPEPVITGVTDVKNDQGGKVRLTFTGSYLDALGDWNLNSYDILRSIPGALAAQRAATGARVRTLAGDGAPLAPGDLVAMPAGATTLYWEYIASLTPLHYVSNYGYVAATTADSVAGSNPLTAFMVVARNYGSTLYWLSSPGYGYSVDNIAPVTPAPFTGQYKSGTTKLHWNPNSETDLAGYRVYRGATAGFVADAAHLVAAPSDTGWVDAAGVPAYYKLTAVDIHGNESPVATLTPAGTTGIEGDAAPRALAFALASANPARSGATLRLALPAAAHARVTLYDAAGRSVRTLADGALAAGTHTLAWDLRDDAGRAAGAGLYFARLDIAGGEKRTVRVVVTP